jgi:type I restriction enzyme S subunit
VKSTITEQDIPFKLPENWTWYYWGDIIQNYQQGLIRANSQLGKIGFEYFKMNNIKEDGTYNFYNLSKTKATEKECEIYKINSGDFFINVRNSRELVGKSCVIGNIDRTILFNHMLIRISHKYYVKGEFINAFLNIPSSKKMIERCKQGTTTVIAIYQNDLYKIPIAIPDIETHNKIVVLYKIISNKIALNNQINDNLEAMAKTIYDYWFVQNADEKWEKKALEEIANIVNGATPSTNEISNYGGEIIWITPKDLSDQKCKFTYYGKRNITDKGYKSCNTTLIPKNSILLSSRAPIGLLSMTTRELCTNQGFKSIIPKDSEMCWYLYYYIEKNIKAIQQLGAGTTFMEVSKISLSSFSITCPPVEFLEKWQLLTKPIFNRQLSIAKENQQLTHLRDYLLPMLMNGQVSVDY